MSVREAWEESDAFNKFRGLEWMKEPCRSCPDKEKDFGGCRCQAYLMTGDVNSTDPACNKSPHHKNILQAIDEAGRFSSGESPEKPLVFRNSKNSKQYL
jgi:pyrroloquinoline quinone biosynthesis protein E